MWHQELDKIWSPNSTDISFNSSQLDCELPHFCRVQFVIYFRVESLDENGIRIKWANPDRPIISNGPVPCNLPLIISLRRCNRNTSAYLLSRECCSWFENGIVPVKLFGLRLISYGLDICLIELLCLIQPHGPENFGLKSNLKTYSVI